MTDKIACFDIFPRDGLFFWEYYWNSGSGSAFSRSHRARGFQTKKEAKEDALKRANSNRAPAFMIEKIKKGRMARPAPEKMPVSRGKFVTFPPWGKKASLRA